MSRPAPVFPFSAIVGQDDLKLALLLTAVDPLIGGVLVRGEKGTAKSTAVRALAAILPPLDIIAGCSYGCDPEDPDSWCLDCHEQARRQPLRTITRMTDVVELPVSATEDRVVGSMSLEHAIKHGERAFEPGLLARANRGILFVDEVNLLDDHLVDVLLDAAAMGVNTVEREGISVTHPARFMLVGTMNPEEGEVRPQLLDRFGLCVEVEGVREPEARVEIIQRRRDFEADPAEFGSRWTDAEAALSERISLARASVACVTLSEDLLYSIASIAINAGVDGHRADTVMARAACAHAALEGRSVAAGSDIARVAPLVLAHRLRRRPFDEPVPTADAVRELVTEVLGPLTSDTEHVDPPTTGTPFDAPGRDVDTDRSGAPPVGLTTTFERMRRTGEGNTQRTASADQRGRYSRSEPMRAANDDVALDATLRAAAPHQLARSADGTAVVIEPQDLHAKVRTRRVGTTIALCVDASGSMGATRRMQAAKGAALALLEQAYQRRDRVSMVAFRGNTAEIVLPPTSSVELASLKLRDVRTGGSTPLALGMLKALEVLTAEQRKDPDAIPWLVLVTDGRANVGLAGGIGSDDARDVASRLKSSSVHVLVLDTNASATSSPAREIARLAGAEYVRLGDVDGESLADAVARRLGS